MLFEEAFGAASHSFPTLRREVSARSLAGFAGRRCHANRLTKGARGMKFSLAFPGFA